LAASLAQGYVSLLALLAVVGAAYGPSQPGGSRAVVSWFPRWEHGFAMGIRQTGIPLGGALAAAVLPTLAARLGWQRGVWLAAGAAFLGGLLFFLFYRDAPGGAKPTDRPTVPFLSQVRQVVSHSRLPLLLAGMTLVS